MLLSFRSRRLDMHALHPRDFFQLDWCRDKPSRLLLLI
jgi:hypothetical protein